ncbi:hypothetical protein HDU79_010890 [Rhizoclosmatium sp. JEL0117]|nr:hypothetical protein HDU79_010890 [Rhizoclosmatium sp. JEL0117]
MASVPSLPRPSIAAVAPASTFYAGASASFAALFSTELYIDRFAWKLWLAGFTYIQAYDQVLDRNKNAAQYNPSVIQNFIISQYRTFEMLEKYLHRPKLLASQLIFPLDKETRGFLIDSYYRFDPKVLRELLGKKLSSRALRKELDDVHIRTKTPLAGCKRMFDNLKRIMKRIEDQNGNIFKLVQDDFLLEDDLAGQYSHIIFINFYRLDTTKKKLANLTFADFDYLGAIIMQYFTITSEAAIDDFDMGLAQDARDLKTIVVNHNKTLDEFRARVITYLQQQRDAQQLQQQQPSVSQPQPSSITSTAIQNVLERCSPNTFKTLLKNVFGLGSGLSYNKEIRDVFGTLMEKIVDPCVAGCGWGRGEVTVFFEAVVAVFPEVELLALHHRKKYEASFGKLCTAVKLAAVRLINV